MHLLRCCKIHEYINTVQTRGEKEATGPCRCHCWMSLLSRSCMLSRVCSKIEKWFSKTFAMCSLPSMAFPVLAICSFMLKGTTKHKEMSETFWHIYTLLCMRFFPPKPLTLSKNNEFLFLHLRERKYELISSLQQFQSQGLVSARCPDRGLLENTWNDSAACLVCVSTLSSLAFTQFYVWAKQATWTQGSWLPHYNDLGKIPEDQYLPEP